MWQQHSTWGREEWTSTNPWLYIRAGRAQDFLFSEIIRKLPCFFQTRWQTDDICSSKFFSKLPSQAQPRGRLLHSHPPLSPGLGQSLTPAPGRPAVGSSDLLHPSPSCNRVAVVHVVLKEVFQRDLQGARQTPCNLIPKLFCDSGLISI